MFGKKDYVKTIARDGSIVYTTKNQFAKAAKKEQIRRENLPTGSPDGTISAAVGKLMNELNDKVKYLKQIQNEASNPKKKQETGNQFAGRMEDMKTTKKEIDNYVAKLSTLGVKVDRDALRRGKVIYEGGHDNMFTTNEIKAMKLDIFEENSKGLISNDLRDYMLTVLESVSSEIERTKIFNEAVEEKINAQRTKFVHFIEEAHKEGLITSTQFEVFNEMAEDDFLFEVTTPDQIPSLVNAYLEAAKAQDEDAKAELRTKIDEANELKALEATTEVVTEGADCSIVEKLESLKIKLSDEEKSMAERFDEMIANAMKKEDDSEEPKKDETPAEEKTDEEPVTEGADDNTEGPANEGEESEEPEAENEPSNDNKKEEGNNDVATESVSDTERLDFGEVTIESSITTEDAESLINYMTEAVADNVYSEADLARVKRMIGV